MGLVREELYLHLRSYGSPTTLWYWKILHFDMEVWAFIHNNASFACLGNFDGLDLVFAILVE